MQAWKRLVEEDALIGRVLVVHAGGIAYRSQIKLARLVQGNVMLSGDNQESKAMQAPETGWRRNGKPLTVTISYLVTGPPVTDEQGRIPFRLSDRKEGWILPRPAPDLLPKPE